MKSNRIIMFIIIIILFIYVKKGCQAMELSGKESDRDEAEKFAEYEMNIVLDLLDIKYWETRSPGVDEWNMPSDEPLGHYSEEALAPYLDGSVEVKVEIEYYTGGFRPELRKVPIVIVKAYEDGALTRIEDVICWGYDQRVEGGSVYDNVEPLGRMSEWQKTDNDPLVKQEPENFRPFTGTVRIPGERQGSMDDGMRLTLNPENITQVMKTLLMTRDEKDKEKLSELPLTERFYQQCMDAEPCIKDIVDMRGFWINYYGVGDDDKVICQCIISSRGNINQYGNRQNWRLTGDYYVYHVEMQLEDGQIDSMDIIFLGHYVLEGNTEKQIL